MKIVCRLFIPVIFLVFFNTVAYTQVRVLGLQEYINYANINKSNERDNSYSTFAGNPFLTKDFKEGQIDLIDGKKYKGLLRYDIYADQIEFQTTDGSIYAVKNPEMVKNLVIDSKSFRSYQKQEGNILEGIYEILEEGNYLLLEKHKVILKDAVPAKPYGEAKPATFHTKRSSFYILNQEGEFIEIENKKSFLELDVEKSNEIMSFIKKNKIKYSDRNDLKELVQYLNIS